MHPHLAIPVQHIYLKRAPSFGDAGSSQILHTSPHVAIPVRHIRKHTPLIWLLAMPLHHLS